MIRKTLTRILPVLVLILAVGVNGWAQTKEPVLSKNERKEVVKNIGDLLNKNYVFPETAKKMSAFLEKKLKKGK